MGLADVQDAGISYNNNATSLVAHACKLLALGRNALPTPDANPLFKIQHRHSGGPASPPAQPLVSSAFVATVSCFRFGYFMGGDGETKLP